MNKERALQREVIALRLLVWLQRSLRLVLRAIWFGGATILLAWGGGLLFERFLDWRILLVLGLIVASVPLFAIGLSWPRLNKFVWLLDRQLGLKEQISTAWGMIKNRTDSRLGDELETDALNLTIKVRQRIVRHGWFLGRDLTSTLIVSLLGISIYLMFFYNPIPGRLSGHEGGQPLMPLGSDPRAEDIFPDGNQAMPPSDQNQPLGDHEKTTASDPQIAKLTENDIQQLHAALEAIGEALSTTAATYQEGQAIKSLNPELAAQAFQSLSDKLDSFSGELKDLIAEAMAEASQLLGGTNLEILGDDLSDAADAVSAAKSVEGIVDAMLNLLAKEKLDQVAQDLLDLASEMRSESGEVALDEPSQDGGESGGGAGLTPGSREKSTPQPFERLDEQGGEIELDVLNESEQAILNPAKTGDATLQANDGTTYDLADSSFWTSDEFYTLYITPYTYPWAWRDVVTTYFQEFR